MNIRNIIGLGLLACFTHCNTPSIVIAPNNQPANCLLATPPQNHQPQPDVKSTADVCDHAKSQQPAQANNDVHFHVRENGKVEKSTKQWKQDGETHETVESEDADHNLHKIHRWQKNGKPNQIDEWVDGKSGASVHSHKFVDGQGCTNEMRVVTDVNGQSQYKHYKKDKQGNITEVQDDDSKGKLGRNRNNSQQTQPAQQKPNGDSKERSQGKPEAPSQNEHRHEPAQAVRSEHSHQHRHESVGAEKPQQHRHESVQAQHQQSQHAHQPESVKPAEPVKQVQVATSMQAPGCATGNLQQHY